ncbi:acetolactate synthase large subunit, partial [Ideonella sp. A 288]|uniref:acetolactate synthase large subunit n=1 Tax=Ideonella sp. A 288 TaxID=1962181 RepID=UPI000B4BF4BA
DCSVRAPAVSTAAVEAAARTLQSLGERAMLLLGAAGSQSERAQQLAAAIGARTGCRVMAEFYNARMPGGRGLPRIDRLPYAVDASVARLAGTQALVLAGSVEPIGFFAYPGKPSQLKPAGAALVTLAEPRQDVPAALQALADALGVRLERDLVLAPSAATPAPDGRLTPESVAAAIAATLPEQAIVVDEAITTGRAFGAPMAAAAPHDWLQGMGGAIGYGLPCAVGAAVAAPGRPVLALEGDGSAMYTLQALWTMARESLPVVAVIFANRSYAILQGELKGVGAQISGQKATDMLTLDRPVLDWVALARGHGVDGVRVDDAGALVQALQRGFASRAPCLIEVVL